MVIQPPPTQSSRRQRVTFAWQGWRLAVPHDWNPVTLSGSFASGAALLADLDGPRLGVRWKNVDPRRVTPASLAQIVHDEVGSARAGDVAQLPAVNANGAGGLAAAYVDPHSPGRDVYAAWFAGSERIIELVYHAHERDDLLVSEIAPSLCETTGLSWQPWAALGLACAVPAGFVLTSHDLRAGDLRLHFATGKRFVSVRQLALAHLALKRTTLERLVVACMGQRQVHFRRDGTIAHVTLTASDGREIVGRCGHARRRRRFFWHAGLTPQRAALALHDRARDRIVIVEADEPSLAREVALTVGGGEN